MDLARQSSVPTTKLTLLMLLVSTRPLAHCRLLWATGMVWKSELTPTSSQMLMTITLKSLVSSRQSSLDDNRHTSVLDSVVLPMVPDLDFTQLRAKTPTDGHTLLPLVHLTEGPSTPSNHLCNRPHSVSVVHRNSSVPLNHCKLLDPLHSLHQEVHRGWLPHGLLLLLLLPLSLPLSNRNVHPHYLVMNLSWSLIPIHQMIQA